MNKTTKTITGFILLTLLFVLSCQKKTDKQDTIIEGKVSIYVDESILPIIEDEQSVFETVYKAKLKLVAQSENEIINSLVKDSAKIAVLTKTLNESEINAIKAKKIIPKITPLAKDAVAFIKNKASNDTLISISDIIDFIKGKDNTSIKGLVFDNANSSTVRLLSEKLGVSIGNQKYIFSLKNNQEVIKYVAENKNMVGVIGMNWILQPPIDMEEFIKKINVLSVKDKSTNDYYFPTQENLATDKYPLARHLYIINCQGYSGLGMGFASFIGGERGQRIILKSGLIPEQIPSRKIVTRNTINNDKK